MPVAFFGPSGRTHATQAALLLARGLAKVLAIRFVRVALPGEPSLPGDAAHPAALAVDDLRATDLDGAYAVASLALAENEADPVRLILDLPPALVADTALRARITLPILAVGPGPLDEATAAEAHARASRVPGARSPAWLLGCDRHGGPPAALAFAEDMALLAGPLTGEPVRTFPCVLPPLSGPRAHWLLRNAPDHHCDALAVALAAMVESARQRPDAASLPVPPDNPLDRDDRRPEERLRALADDLAALDEGAAPTAEVMRRAPILNDWAYETRPRRVLTGTVASGHPDIRPGRRTVTSEVFASNGRDFARTLSRWWRLGTKRPA